MIAKNAAQVITNKSDMFNPLVDETT